MRYCQRCILPETRPGIELDADGVCSACESHHRRAEEVEWGERRRDFGALVAEVTALGRRYDCVVPVSGGKDSTWQVVTCLEHGLHPLAVTWRTPVRTEVGEANLRNLVGLGVDHVDFSINPKVERRFLRLAFERYGTTAIPMHMAIFNVPLAVAAGFEVPLVVWGENSAAEYVGDEADGGRATLDAEWVRKYGAVHGTSAEDWVGEQLSREDLAPYFGPGDEELAARGVRAVFLGHFFRWDPELTAKVAAEHGFQAAETPKTGYYAYADIDDAFIITIHHWLKWHKFGFTRTWDNLSLEIRNGRMTRDEAIAILRERGDETPHGEIEVFREYVGMQRDEVFEVAERFRNQEIWTKRNGTWVIEDFLIPDWDWS